MTTPERDPLEDRIASAFRGPSRQQTDLDDFLADVHSGARRRRARRNIAGSAAAVLLLAGAGAAVTQAGLFGQNGAPIADHVTTAATSVTPTASSDSATTAIPPLSGVMSLTSTGVDAQWALVATSGRQCGRSSCGIVFANPVGTDTWTPLPEALPAGSDPTSTATVSQLRFAGSATSRYDGWAYGGALFTTHSNAHHEAGTSWRKQQLPVPGPVTALEAHGDSVYAVVSGPTATLLTSPVARDEWQPVDVGRTLQDVSQLVVSTGVVALLDHTGAGSTVVTLDAGSWTSSDPCDGHVTELSTASTTLWALCDDGGGSTVWQKSDGSDTWTQVGPTYPTGSLLAGRTVDDALVAADSGLVTVAGPTPTLIDSRDFTTASMFGFTNPDVGFVIESGQVYRTDNAGRDWHRVNVGG